MSSMSECVPGRQLTVLFKLTDCSNVRLEPTSAVRVFSPMSKLGDRWCARLCKDENGATERDRHGQET